MKDVGLGLRRALFDEAIAAPGCVGFWEVAPENWIPYPASYQHRLEKIKEQAALTCHGLSLSIGSPDPLDETFVVEVKNFLDKFGIDLYSEHLSYCSAEGHLYDLLPIPFTESAVDYVVGRIKRVQDILERPLVIENVSYYAALSTEISELDFINRVLEQSDCQLLLDVNNVYVNSINHSYDPYDFIAGLPSHRVVYGHIAGHYDEAPDLLIDTHGTKVKPEVFKLLKYAYEQHGVFPTLLERDFNIPPLQELCQETRQIRDIQLEVRNGR